MTGRRSTRYRWLACSLLAAAAAATAQTNPAAPGFDLAGSDPEAIEIADAVMESMGGRQAWDRTRFVTWNFFDARRHFWDRHTGDVRIEWTGREDGSSYLVLMNLTSKEGRAWRDGTEATGDALAGLLDQGEAAWINDAYWMFMPYKLKDTGVALKYRGERAMQDGRQADVLELTFANVGLTPDNRYEVLVDKQTRLVGEWTFYRAATDSAATFTMPWKDWRRVGSIMLCADHGREADWKLAAYESLPRSVFERPDPVRLQ